MRKSSESRLRGSFRDPEGFLFSQKGEIFRQINETGKENFEQLMQSGLYQLLADKGLLIAHKEVKRKAVDPRRAHKVIKPVALPFISYPYEWSFSELKDAALLTLDIQKEAIGMGMSLKDASAFNVQFDLENGRPVFIDTLSFENFFEARPWAAYRQFCQHFLAPLALASFRDIRLSQLLRANIDGIPLDLAAKLLPRKAFLRLGLYTHLWLHSKAQSRYSDAEVQTEKFTTRMTKTQHLGLLDSLRRTTASLSWQAKGTEWGTYYQQTNYEKDAFEAKKKLVRGYLDIADPKTVWDMGANNGVFSRIASENGRATIAFDVDAAAVEQNYLQMKAQQESNLLPLVLDLTNPSPSLGWNNQERLSLPERGSPDLVMALALIHHLAISNNLPLAYIAEYFSQLSEWLIIEFVPKSDSQVKKLLVSRKDIFPNYTFAGFQESFTPFFSTQKVEGIKNTERKLILLRRKN